MRSSIGAALQEAALDPLLTGAEHMRLQTALHGIPKAERAARGTELLARVGLAEAGDRKVGGYSGGMKRRLDLALALAHGPSILFLDEPTTGLDIQSRTALWDEVARLAAEEGVTVFLTTQYLEEADALAGRVGIIDHGQIVAEGTPAALKAEIGRPTVEAVPREPGERERLAAVLERFGERAGSSPAAPRRGWRGASPSSPRSCGRSTARGSRSRTCSCTRPRSTTSSSPRPAARWRAPAAPGRPRRSRSAAREPGAAHPGRAARPPLGGAHPAPAGPDRPGAGLPALPARGQLGRAAKTRPACRASRPTPTSPLPSPCPSSRGACSR